MKEKQVSPARCPDPDPYVSFQHMSSAWFVLTQFVLQDTFLTSQHYLQNYSLLNSTRTTLLGCFLNEMSYILTHF